MAKDQPVVMCSEAACGERAYATGRCKEHYEVYYQSRMEIALARLREQWADILKDDPHYFWRTRQGAHGPTYNG